MAIALLLLLFASTGFAQHDAPDFSKLEVAGSWWPVHTSGSIQANGTPVDLHTDLGVNQNVASFTGKLDARLGRRHSIRVEGTPFRLDGTMDLARTISYQGRVFSITDHVTSKASLDYVYAGYLFDVLSRPGGHVGLQVGGAYLNTTGSITSRSTGTTASRSQTVGMPLAGIVFRAFPVHGAIDIEINGDLKGMNFGRYGNFVQAAANVGIGRGHVFVEGGYRFVNADVHDARGVNAVSPEFRGPVVSLLFRL